MVTTTTDPHAMLQQPVVVTSSKANAGPSILKAALGGQGKKLAGEGKVSNQLIRERYMLLFQHQVQ